MKNKPTLVITPGDPEGIGPEVTKKALNFLKKELEEIQIIIFGAKFLIPKNLNIQFRTPPANSSPGYQSGWSITQATEFILQSPDKKALITGPIHKERLQDAGFPYVGHTDFLANLTQSKNVTMVLANAHLKVALITNHCPLRSVSKKITRQKIITTIDQVASFCITRMKIKKPKIAVLGLNPHAGENGRLGKEELNIIVPAIRQAIQKSKNHGIELSITGPHSADSFFAIEKKMYNQGKGHDFIIAQYHDQGLIPVKLMDFNNSLNLTLGLPFIRTSVDHGTAFDIAGKNKANPGSMIYAIRKAIEFL